MHNLWLIARHEYRQRAGARSFLVATLGLPILVVAIIALIIVLTMGGGKTTATGYVDRSGVLARSVMADTAGAKPSIELRAFPDAAAARAALEKGEIKAFYVLDENYRQTLQAELYYWDAPPDAAARQDFGQFIRANLVAGLPDAARERLVAGPQVTVRSADGARSISAGQYLNIVAPFVVALFFVFAALMSAGLMLQVVTDEKESRTVEVLITSVSPEQLIGGKALGLMGVALTQVFAWLLALLLLAVVGGQFVEPLRGARVPWDTLLVVGLYFLPAYALITGMMTAIGGAVTEVRHGQQIAGILNMLFVLPLLLSALVFTNPNSPLLVAMTLFPTTSFVTVSLRWGLVAIPAWQLGVSWLLLAASALFSVWAAARIFRAGMLRYGQQLSLHGALAALGTRVR